MKINKKNTLSDGKKPIAKKIRNRSATVSSAAAVSSKDASKIKVPTEINGPKGPEPTRYGDWEQKGRCTDF